MKIQKFIFLFLALATCVLRAENNSFTPGEIWPDNNGVHINAHGGGLLLKDGIYYWYGEHKTKGTAGNVSNVGFSCYSSTDLYRWKDEGIVLKVAPDKSGSDIEKGSIMERPKVIFNKKTGKYVMWFHLELKNKGYNTARSGVAVSDSPTGPFTYLRSTRINAGKQPLNANEVAASAGLKTKGGKSVFERDFDIGQMARDMTLFVDDDGTAYHIYASEDNATLHIAELSADFLSHTGRYTRNFAGRSMEAPALFKKDGKYYLIMSGCTGWAPNAGRSAVANSVLGPWTELKNPFKGENANKSFNSQSTYIQPIVNSKGETNYLYMGDRWNPRNAIDGRHIWLPIRFDGDQPVIEWKKEWQY